MTIKSSGSSLRFSEIANEFGLPPNNNLGAYRVNETVSGLTNLPLDTGVPQSGTIKFSDFYDKQLNVVVDCTSTSILTRITARSRYDSKNNLRIVGGFRDRPDSPSNIKVWIHTNSTIGSDVTSSIANNRRRFSLSTGNWESTTDLRLDVGPNGLVTGAGGDGGRGGNVDRRQASNGNNGFDGTGALAVVHKPIIITNRGRIQGGGGGGGGGAASWNENRRSRRRDVVYNGAGGGGGGGFGYPAGVGGAGGVALNPLRSSISVSGQSGTNGSIFNAGNGGNGGFQSGGAITPGGGGGGSPNGIFGSNIFFSFTYESSTTQTDPGIGRLRLNNTNLSLATQLYIDNFDNLPGNQRNDITRVLNAGGQGIDSNSSTSPYYKGFFRLTNASRTSSIVFSIREITELSSPGSYCLIDCVYVSGTASFANGESIFVYFDSSSPSESTPTTGSRPALSGENTQGGTGGSELITNGSDDRGNLLTYFGGTAGQTGFSIMVNSNSSGVTITNNGTIVGTIEYNSSGIV